MIRLYTYLGAAVIIAAGVWGYGHWRYNAGDAHGQQAGVELAASALDRQLEAERQTASCAASLAQANAETASAESAAAAQIAAGREAVAQARASERDASRTLAEWVDRYADSIREPGCKGVASAMLCESMMDY